LPDSGVGPEFRVGQWEQAFPRVKHQRFSYSNGRESACDQPKGLQPTNESSRQGGAFKNKEKVLGVLSIPWNGLSLSIHGHNAAGMDYSATYDLNADI
jgi:hypothetical protein